LEAGSGLCVRYLRSGYLKRDRHVGDEVRGSVRCLRRRALLPWLLARAGLVAVAVVAASAVPGRPPFHLAGRLARQRHAQRAGRRLAFDLIVAMATL
jgi:hypothetical protein